jgi:catechol 2,3-dioxygenase-like lactoylglutathione lyase family enzyme
MRSGRVHILYMPEVDVSGKRKIRDEIRAFFHDPDGYLLEISETRPAEVRRG